MTSPIQNYTFSNNFRLSVVYLFKTALVSNFYLFFYTYTQPILSILSYIRAYLTLLYYIINIDATKASGQRLVGDVAFEEAKKVAAYITAVPGGVGPMTVAMLMRNTVQSYLRAASKLINMSWNVDFLPLDYVKPVPRYVYAYVVIACL